MIIIFYMIYLHYKPYYSRIIFALCSIVHCTKNKITHDDANTCSRELLKGKCQGFNIF